MNGIENGAASAPHDAVRETPAATVVDRVVAVARTPNPAGERYIERVLDGVPARRVRRSRHNGAARLASWKTGFSQEAESHSIELPTAFEFEFDSRVRIYDSQPESVLLDYRSAGGRRVTPKYTPDYLVILDDGRAAIVECKPKTVILKAVGKGDPRWKALPLGRYFDPVATEVFGHLGLPHVTITEEDINHRLFANQRFLGLRYLHEWSPSANSDQLLTHVRDAGTVWINDLLAPERIWTSDDVWGAIARTWIYVDLYAVALNSREPYPVYSSKPLYEAIKTRSSGARQEKNAAAMEPPNELQHYSRNAIEVALSRLALIRPVLQNTASATSLSRTERNWLRSFRRSEREGVGFLGLLPAYHRRGDHQSRLLPAVETALERIIDQYLDPSQPRGTRYYGELRRWCALNGYSPPSRTTFYKRLRLRETQVETIQARRGRDAAYQARAACAFSESANARRAQRAWQIAYIDHTPLPIRCVSSELRAPISGHVVLTIMRDGYTNGILGFYLSYQSPSQTTLMAVLWDVYRRYERLPEWLHLDGEQAHDAVAVEQLLARGGVHKLARRYKAPRDGSLVENDFFVLQQQLITYLRGNYVDTQDPKRWHERSGPKQQAQWTIGGLYGAIRRFVDHRNTRAPQPRLGGLTADAARIMSEELHGRSGTRIAKNLTDAAYVMLPSARRGEYRKFRSNTGLRLNYLSYVPTEPLGTEHDGEYVAVRYDPFDIRYCLVELRGRWRRFVLRQAASFEDLSTDFLSGVTIELIEIARQCKRRHDSDGATELSTVLSEIEDGETDPLESLKRTWEEAASSAEKTLVETDSWAALDPDQLETIESRFEEFDDE